NKQRQKFRWSRENQPLARFVRSVSRRRRAFPFLIRRTRASISQPPFCRAISRASGSEQNRRRVHTRPPIQREIRGRQFQQSYRSFFRGSAPKKDQSMHEAARGRSRSE